MLPRRDGFAVLESLRADGGAAAKTPALLLSGVQRTPQYLERAGTLGAHALLTKPVPLDKLMQAVRAAGVRLVEVGLADRYAGAGVRDAEPWEIAFFVR